MLTARGITKTFPGVIALRDVSFDLRPGEIHALCGENGAGKSTLIKLLSGLHPHGSYEGELLIDAQPAHFRDIADAGRAGLAVIYQELALIDEMSVAENIFLGDAPRRGPFIDWSKLHHDARTLLQRFGVSIDPAAPLRRLGGRRKAARRNRQGPREELPHPHPRRTHRRACRARSPDPPRHPARPAHARPELHLHLAPARRSLRPRRSHHRPARWRHHHHSRHRADHEVRNHPPHGRPRNQRSLPAAAIADCRSPLAHLAV
ncbi:MAG: ATP-binding cassette domain-containing protein [Chthoniobacter sp.]